MTRENDISAQKEIQEESSWIQKKNEYEGRKKSFSRKKIKGKKEIVSLGHIYCGLSS
jgi:hypothetical protein